MQTTGNTILITGGGSGIGRALAESFHALGNQVILAGRRQYALDQTTTANPGMSSVVLDIEDPANIRSVAGQLASTYPTLNAVIHNAGIMQFEDLLHHSEDLTTAQAIVTTNLLGPIRLNAALLPHLLRQPSATIMTVTSGLAFVPLAPTPTYCATKAALHSYTQSLRYQLKSSSVQVLELIPPYVQTELMGPGQASDPRAMPLNEYIAEVMGILTTQPDTTEICVQRVLPLRNAEQNGKEQYDAFFQQFNDAMAAAH